MKKNIPLVIAFFFSIYFTFAQKSENHNCGSDEIHLKLLKENPSYKDNFERNNQLWQNWSKIQLERSVKQNRLLDYPDPTTLPIVFHDVSNSGSFLNNTGDYQYIVQKLNAVFSGVNFTNNPPSDNSFIEFCLALQDKNGDMYTGLQTHHSTSISVIDKSIENHLINTNSSAGNYGPNAKFPTSKYINVYVVDSIQGPVAGFAFLPSAHGTANDGIYIERAYLQNNALLDDHITVLAHEMGHYLGLFHVFGICDPNTIASFPQCSCDNGNCLFNGDMVCDTAPIELNYICTPAPTSCGSTVADDKSNYMDYGNCRYRFTMGQIERMHFMIDAEFGARRSLLLTNSCENCTAMDECEFNILLPSQLTDNNNTVIVNNSITFNQSTSCTNNPSLNYTWEVININNGSTVLSGTGASFDVNIALASNYKIILTASLQTNSNCFEQVEHIFQVIPEANYGEPSANICGIIPPMSSSLWGKWYRDIPDATSIQNPASNTDVAVINASSFSDPNFIGITPPAGIDEIIRVGRVIDGNTQIAPGRAYYANVSFKPKQANCKYRIHFLTMTGATSFSEVDASVFHLDNNDSNNDYTTIGFSNLYNLDSEVTGTINNVTYGENHIGFIGGAGARYQFCDNNLIFGKQPSSKFTISYNNALLDEVYYNINYKKMAQWDYIDVDYAEFAKLNLEVTLTFFSKSNNASGGLQSSYGYFAIECLGGGTPSSIEWDPQNIDMPCTFPANVACIEIPIPRPEYIHYQYGQNWHNYEWLNNPANRLANITLERSADNVNFTLFPDPIVTTTLNDGVHYNLKLCTLPIGQFTYFRIKYNMLNQEIIRTIRVINPFYHDTICDEPQIPGTEIYGGIIPSGIENQQIVCPDTATNLTLTYTDPCFNASPSYEYRWKFRRANDFVELTIPNAGSNASLQFTLEMLDDLFRENNSTCFVTIWREAKYTDPYCSNSEWFKSEEYTIYNLVGFYYKTNFSLADTQGNEPCLREDMVLNLNFTLKNEAGCEIPEELINEYVLNNNLSSFNNNVTIEVISSPQNIALPQSPFTINYGPNLNFLNNNFNLTFNNEYATDQFYILPLQPGQDYNLKVFITYNFFGCSRTISQKLTVNVAPSAIGGQIALSEDCYLNNIMNVDSEISLSANGYSWEYSYTPTDSNSFLPIPNASTASSLINVEQYFPASAFPVYIRRVSNSIPVCPGEEYSNILLVNPNPPLVFEFDLEESYCSTNIPTLPNTSITGIQGTWNPTTITQSGSYTFTPNNNECGDSFVYNVIINTSIAPTFDNLTTQICAGDAVPELPLVSSNGITGHWSETTISNTTSNTYYFYPDEGQCATSFEYVVTVIPVAYPEFSINSIYCQNSGTFSLPSTSNNGIQGTWTPSSISTTNTGDYVFHFESNDNACAVYNLNITVLPANTLPIFDLPTGLCEGSSVPTLPSVSVNGILGTWSPVSVNNMASGSYTFTPNSNQCALPYVYNLSIETDCSFSLSWNGAVGCQESEEDDHKIEDVNIVDGPCIKVCENSTITYTLVGESSLIVSTDWNITGGTIIDSSNTTCEIQWNAGTSQYALQGTIYLTNGTTQNINKCIEKVASPIAQIGILPDLEIEEHTLCLNNPINFQNLSTSNGGNENLYYLWDFGDGTFSTEFEPSHIYTEEGDYNVKLTVSNGCSCVGIDEIKVHIVNETIDISCPSVACEGQVSIYSINPEIVASCHDMQWSVIGGHIVGENYNTSSIEVLWDTIDEDGFGYVFIQSSECYKCVSSVKIPVVKNEGTIKGEISTCQMSQYLYTLPQWPTTEFNWTLNANGTGAVLVASNQRNEIFINTQYFGTIVLNCQYYNTLLNCGGNATLTIKVNPFIAANGPNFACQNQEVHYDIITEPGIPATHLSYTINGPDNYAYTGNALSFDVAFPEPGIYLLNITADNYCMDEPIEIIVSPQPPMPSTLNGNTTICPGITAVFSCPPFSGSQTHWSIEGGTILGSTIGNQVTVSFDPLASAYSISAWYQKDSCASEHFTLPLSIPVLDTAISNNYTSVCGSSSGQYSVNETDAESYFWHLEPADAGSISTGQNSNSISILWNQEPQIASVHLTMRKCGKEYESIPLEVTITAPPTATIAPNNNSACAGELVTFSVTLPSGISFNSSTWDFGDNTPLQTFLAGQTITHTYNDPLLISTTYNVTASVSGASNCVASSTAQTQVTVSPTPIIYVTPNKDYNYCEYIYSSSPDMNYTVTLQDGFAETSNIQWYFNNTAVGGNSPTIDASSAGVYYAVVTNEFGCTANTPIYRTNPCDLEPGPGGCEAPPAITVSSTNINCQGILINITDSGAALGFTWGNLVGSNATIITQNSNQFIATNILPGAYQIPIRPTYAPNSNYCYVPLFESFIIPYKADLKYNVQCNSNNGVYDVMLLNHSSFYAETPIETFEFTINGGASWTSASINDTFSTTLPPGTYQIGIRIDRSDYPSCTAFKTLVLPNLPNANFEVPDAVCLNTPMQFMAPNNTDPDLTYIWDFDGAGTNLQPNPVKTFISSGIYYITLTVENKYGCATSVTKTVQVVGTSYDDGFLNISAANTCVGDDLTITYELLGFGTLPESYIWYHNEVTATPFAVTDNYNNQLVVQEPGQYFAYVADASGCLTYTTPAVAANFVPAPEQPIVTGTATLCKGSQSRVSIPANPSLSYQWWLNGVPQSQWNNQTEVGKIHTQTGTYIYQVAAQIVTASGSVCSSTMASFEVTVLNQPNVPSIAIDFESCSPYLVSVYVANPQAGIQYTWSNGDTGVSTQMIHDGPIRVTASSTGCEVSSQIDLPLDLFMHTWYYPTGCYTFCRVDKKEANTYIIGPLVDFKYWEWMQDYHVIQHGIGQVEALNNPESGTYQLFLLTPYCETTLSNITIERQPCEACEFEIDVKDIKSMVINGECLYQVDIFMDNPFNEPLQIHLASPNLDGYWVQNSFWVPSGGSVYSVLFYPLNGFVGGPTSLTANSMIDDKLCLTEIEFELPPLCEEAGRLSLTESTDDLVLLAAPNPTDGMTNLYFNCGNTKGTLNIEILDMYGRMLQQINPKENSGTLSIDCSRYEAGQYFVIMRKEGQILKNCKLIIK